MPKFYLVRDVGPGFDGVVVEGEPVITDSSSNTEDVVVVHRFVDTNMVLGDRYESTPVTPGSILMDLGFLTEVSDPQLREFDSKNPYGRFQLEGHMTCGGIKVAYSQYERALQVNVMEDVEPKYGRDVTSSKTLLALNFTKDFQKVKSLIESSLRDHDEAEQLVFKLQELHDNG